ncbi:hypothetical protein [Arthrobacter sp. JSM 101049]|uniref:hypothetical protein n=1 Tax=Arthrobacter sp. JSM 101049 TaxID=929097 RepID=UPI0035632B35
MLTNSDIALIKAATHTEFNWPPAVGEGAPQAAFDLSMVRLRQMQQGSVIAEFTAKDLANLRRAGLVDADFLQGAIEYLKGCGRDDDRTAGSSSQAPPTDLTRASGTVAQDGAVYL